MTQYRDSVDSLRDSPHSERSDPTAWCHPGAAEASRARVCLCPALEQQPLVALENLQLWSYQRKALPHEATLVGAAASTAPCSPGGNVGLEHREERRGKYLAAVSNW